MEKSRKMNRVLFIVLLAILPLLATAQTDSEAEFVEANRLYREDNFAAAIEKYQHILSAGYESGELYYNLGNAYFKSGRLGLSILYYEKAKILLPRDPDLLYNLKMVRMRIADKVEVPRLAIWKLIDKLRDFLPLNTLATLSGIFFLLFLIIGGAYYFFPKGVWKKSLFYAAIPVLIVFLLLALDLSVRAWRIENINEGILLVDKIEVLSAPDEGAKGLFSLHEGVKFRIEQKLPPWAEIALPDGKKGWITLDAFGEI